MVNKRLKLDFQPGHIKQVTLENFTTYSYVQFKLSPSLNMIIGPNGTGKSTLVSAICLGLGGKLDLIKRKSLKSMIKTDATTSIIEIILQDEYNKELVIKRTFTENSTKWEINGRKSTETQVVQRVTKLNIQLNNLCHFLPQERVAEFAGLSPEKLLVETQRTLKSGDLYVKHQDIIRLEEQRDVVEEQLLLSDKKLQVLETEKVQLEEAVAKLNQLNEKTEELNLHKNLLPYAIYEDERHQRRQLKETLDSTKARLNEFESKKQPLSTSLKEIEVQLTSLTNTEDQYNRTLKDLKDQLHKLLNESEEVRDGIMKLKEALNESKKSRQNKQQEIQALKRQINEHETDLKSMDNIDVIEQLNELKLARSEKQPHVQELITEVSDIENSIRSKEAHNKNLQDQIDQEITRLNDKDKLNILQNIKHNQLVENTFQLHKLLRTNKDLKLLYFEAPVVTCNLTYSKLGGVMERVIGQNNLLALTFVSRDNYDKVPKDVFKRFNAPIRVVNLTGDEPPIPPERLNSFGFERYLCSYLNGPQEVLNMLNVNSKLNLIPVSTRDLSEAQLEALLKPDINGRIPFMRFVSGQQLFTVTRSRYGNKSFVYSSETLTETRFFRDEGISLDVKNEIEVRIETMRQETKVGQHQIEVFRKNLIETKSEYKRLKHQMDELQVEIGDLNSQRSRIVKITAQIQSKNERIDRLHNDLSKDQTSRINKIKSKILDKNIKYANTMNEMTTLMGSIAETNGAKNQVQFETLQLTNRQQCLNILLVQLDEYREGLVEAYEAAKMEYGKFGRSDATKQIAEIKRKLTEPEMTKLATLAQKYKQQGELTARIVRDKITLIEDEINVSTADKSSVNKLKQIIIQLEEINAILPSLRSDKDSLDRRISKIEAEWEPLLTRLVAKLSKTFKKRFVAVASNGEVQLAKALKYKDWRLEILVKFRNESELKILDRQSQSGGERAVSTIFFIMALQKLTNAPFRIVDEINQGMDPKNEKNAHKYLVHAACESTQSQYFLVTPKLLTGLYYHPQMRIHCIYTGPLIKGDKQFLDFTNKM